MILQREVKGTVFQVLHSQPEFNDELIQLDRTAEMSVYLCGLIRAGRNITVPYERLIEYKGYRQGMVLVARVKNSEIVGKVCVGIKESYLFQSREKVAYLFDMRIALSYQRMGVGRLLYEAIQVQSKKLGCTVAVCSVNSNNVKSINFFLKSLNFSLGSQRKIFNMMSSNEPFVNQRTVALQDGSECVVKYEPNRGHIVAKAFDYCPVNPQELIQSKHYLGQVTAKKGDNTASIHLYKGDKQFGMTLQRLFLTVPDWSKWTYRIMVFILMMALPVGLTVGSINLDTGTIKNKVMFGFGIGTGVLSLALQFGIYYVMGLINAPFIRAFGYDFAGNNNEKQILQQLIKHVKSFAGNYGARTVRINQDVRARYLPLIEKHLKSFGGKINTMYLYKYFNAGKKDNELFSDKVLFDPRDI